MTTKTNSLAPTFVAACRAKFGDAIKDWDDAKIIKAMGKVRKVEGAYVNVKLGIEGKNSHLNRPEVTVTVDPTKTPAKAKGKGAAKDPLLDALKKTA